MFFARNDLNNNSSSSVSSSSNARETAADQQALEMASSSSTTTADPEDEEEELEELEYDLWEGQFSLSGEGEDAGSDAKAVKNARNQQKLLDSCPSADLDNLIMGLDSLQGLNCGGDRRLRLLQQQMSNWSMDVPMSPLTTMDSPMTLDEKEPPFNQRFKNGGDYLQQWQQSLVKNDELTEEVQMLTEKVGALTESQADTDDKYSKVKQDNASLRSKIDDLEEEVRELQVQSQEQLESEQKRSKEMIARFEREKQLEAENYAMKLQNLEREHLALQEEAQQLRQQMERLKLEKRSAEEFLAETQNSLANLREEYDRLDETSRKERLQMEEERLTSKHLIQELSKEVDVLRNSSPHHTRTSPLLTVHSLEDDLHGNTPAGRVSEMEAELKSLREELRRISADNVDLKGQVLQHGVEQGKRLMSAMMPSSGDISIEDEMKSENEGHQVTKAELREIRTELKEQKEVNFQLRHYIDGILMNIMEKYPELLEVRK